MSGFTVKRDSGLFIGDVGVAPASGTIEITENGTDIDVARYAKANVNVSGLTVDIETYSNRVTKCEPIPNQLYDIQIPEDTTLNMIDDDCCFANSNIGTVTIGDNIASINRGLSQNQYGENNVILHSAFGCCKNLTSVYGGKNVSYIGDLSFFDCNELVNVEMLTSSNLSKIGDYAFYGCGNLNTSIILHEMQEIGDSAFKYTQLKEIKIISTATNSSGYADIRSHAFYQKSIISCHYDKIVLNTKGGSTLRLEHLVFNGDTNTTVSVLAILSNDITFETETFSDFHSNITDFYTHLNQSDFTSWLNNLNDTTLKNAITNATNIHYEYVGDGSEL